MIFEYFTELFPYDKFAVEYEAYKSLKDTQDLNYIAVPWTQLLNNGWVSYPNAKEPQYYFRTLSKEKILQQNNFTVCQHDDYMALRLYFNHLNITNVFCPLHNINNQLPNINIIPISFTTFLEFDERNKDILFSFIGSYTTHPIRERMKNRINGDNIIYRNGYHITTNSFNNEINLKEAEEKEYKDMMERSRFCLCPRGSSPSSVRFWESLQAGTIPILISDFWCLPEWDWNNTIIHLKESEFENMTYKDILNMLKNISAEKETIMRNNCKNAYNKFKKENYKEYITSKL
jgi:hypothetical protein